ncbi:MAG TPA: ABC transporter permease, partial [Chryseosolibacter sp.]
MKSHGPPHLFLRFFRWFCHPSLKDPVEGDLMELYLERRKQFGRRSADLKFALDVLLLFRPGIVKFPNFHHPNTAMMYKSYFKIGWRNLVRDKLYSLIKILGLSIGLTVCMLIFLYSKDEISYDQFHQNKGRIFRIIQHWDFGPEQKQTIGVTNGVLGEAFASQVPEVAEYVRVNGIDVWVKKGSDIVHESPLAVDSNFFSVFSFTLAEGDPRTALHDLHSIILSREVARRYFGTDDAMGKTMQMRINDDLWDFTVTGITDRSPQNSTIKIDMLVPFGLYTRYINNNKGWLGGSM